MSGIPKTTLRFSGSLEGLMGPGKAIILMYSLLQWKDTDQNQQMKELYQAECRSSQAQTSSFLLPVKTQQ